PGKAEHRGGRDDIGRDHGAAAEGAGLRAKSHPEADLACGVFLGAVRVGGNLRDESVGAATAVARLEGAGRRREVGRVSGSRDVSVAAGVHRYSLAGVAVAAAAA